MAKSKIHWSGPGSLQCAVSRSRGLHAARHLSQDAQSFLGLSKTSPDFCCATCTKAARLALATESAPKADTRTDSDRYAELRKIVEAWQSHTVGSSQKLAEWSHR